VDTEYAWYQQHQQQQRLTSPQFASVLLADCNDDDADKTAFIYPASPVDYCPSCVALFAAEADAAATSTAASEGVNAITG